MGCAIWRRRPGAAGAPGALALIVVTIVGWTVAGQPSPNAEPRIVEATSGEVWIEDAPLAPDANFTLVRPAGFVSELVNAPVFGELGELPDLPPCVPPLDMHCAGEPCENAATDQPRERHLRADYVIEPPDILAVEVHAEGADKALADAACGERLVQPDGQINLSVSLGSVQLGGLRLDEAPDRILDVIRATLPNAEVEVSVFAQNSKVYYVIVECGKDGDLAARYPAIGDETIKDALANVREMLTQEQLEQKRIWVARPQPGTNGSDTILPIDLGESPDGGSMADYPLEPGDRLFIASPPDFWQAVGGILSMAWQSLSENPDTQPKR